MAKRTLPEEVVRPLTLGVLVIIFVSVAALQFINRQADVSPQEELALPDLDLLVDQFIPADATVDDVFQPRLSEAALQEEELQVISSDGELLRVVVSKPAGTGPFAGVVLVHGSRASTRETDEISEQLGVDLTQEFDVVTVAIDYRESDLGEEEVDDVLSAVAWLYNVDATEEQPVLLIGVDSGAYIAHRAAQRATTPIRGVVGAYGISDPALRLQRLSETDENAADLFLETTGCHLATDRDGCLEELRIDPARLAADTLLIHNASDTIVSIDHSRRLADGAQDGRVQTHFPELDSTEHELLYSRTLDGYQETIDILYAWVQERLDDNEVSELQEFNEEVGKRIRQPIIIGTESEIEEPDDTPDTP